MGVRGVVEKSSSFFPGSVRASDGGCPAGGACLLLLRVCVTGEWKVRHACLIGPILSASSRSRDGPQQPRNLDMVKRTVSYSSCQSFRAYVTSEEPQAEISHARPFLRLFPIANISRAPLATRTVARSRAKAVTTGIKRPPPSSPFGALPDSISETRGVLPVIPNRRRAPP